MQTFIYVLGSTFIFAYLSRVMEVKDKIFGSKYFLILMGIIIVIVPAMRSNIGDTYVYISAYNMLDEIPHNLSSIIQGGDWGYTLLTLALRKISTNPQIMIFVTATITQILYLRFFLKYKSIIELEVFMYVAAGCFLVTMNGIRQALAAGIIVSATGLLIDKKIIKYVLVILLASTIHQSAILMIPVYFIAHMKPWTRKTVGIILVASIGFFGFYSFMPGLFQVIGDSQYGHYQEIFEKGTEQGANILRLAVAAVPLVLAFIRRKKLEEWGPSKIFINMSLINFIFMLFSLQTWIFARFSMYFNLYNIVLLPYIVKEWSNIKERRLVYFGFIVCYLIFFLVEHRGWIIKTNYPLQRIFYDWGN